MSYYRLTAFEDATLPPGQEIDDLSTGRAPSTLIDVAGGTFDAYGTRARLPSRQEIGASGLYVGAYLLADHAGNLLVDHAGNLLIPAAPTLFLRHQVDRLRALVGRRGRLWRRREDGALQWRLARLLRVQVEGNVERAAAVVAQTTATFEAAGATWKAAAGSSSTTALTTSSTKTANVETLGNGPVEDAVITVTATGTITSFRLYSTALGVDWTWTGSLTAGQSLVVDCGALTVRKQGVDAYSGFALNAGHTAAGWLPLAAGSNTLLMVANQAGSCVITYYDQWL